MLSITTALLLSLLSIVNGAPVSDAGSQAIARRDSPGIPGDIPGPKNGDCSVLVFSASILSLGGVPTSVTGEGIGPSEQGEPQVVVINKGKDIVGGPVPFAPQSPGFAASIPLNKDMIVNAQTLNIQADGLIGAGLPQWGIKYQYGADKHNCKGACLVHHEHTGVFGAYDVHQGFFAC